MIYLLLGRPGTGKTTLGKKLEGRLGYTFLSVGELLRSASQGDSEIKKVLDKGSLVPDIVCQNVLKAYLANTFFDTTPVVIDGFPRSSEQAVVFNWNLVAGIIMIKVDDDEAQSRLMSRGREDDNKITIETRNRMYDDNIKQILKIVKEYGIPFTEVYNEDAEDAYIDVANFIRNGDK